MRILEVTGVGLQQKHQPLLSQCASLAIIFLFTQNTFRAKAEKGKAIQIGQEMQGDRPTWGTKGNQSRFPFIREFEYKVNPSLLFSLYSFWYGQCFLRKQAHHEWSTEKY